ncbi:MAG TPA: hypothetical protein VKA18_06660 [Alphaproteobacteria bacterium]|nr:hypothetical protein [Alphaproteobacteria bacterium]
MANKFVALENIQEVLYERTIPTVTLYNRLEGRPRTDNFERALRAEVRDALWMITRQWQMGEFRGDDAGSPVLAKAHIRTTALNKYQAAEHPAQAFRADVPLEAKVEQRPFPFKVGDQEISLDLRLLMGRQWNKMLAAEGLGHLRSQYRTQYPIEQPDPGNRDQAQILAHREAWQQIAAVAGRRMDGAKLYFYLKADPGHHAYDSITLDSDGDKPTLDQLAEAFTSWFEKLFFQPAEPQNNAWKPGYLEYQFGASAPHNDREKVLNAKEYYQGHLDWYNLDIDPEADSLGEVPDAPGSDIRGTTLTLLPATIDFDGMPHTRWWRFEEGKTHFGDISPDTTDLNKLLLMEFALVYANDWFLIPFDLPVGTLAEVRGLTVTNVFGERFWINPSGKGADEDWQRWSMFNLSIIGDEEVGADQSLLLLPTVPKILESKPLEQFTMTRDEMANMVWGIEERIPLPAAGSKPGPEAAHELRRFYEQWLADAIESGDITPEEAEYMADIRYQVMTRVPENWIPFIPVHVPGSNREIQLQRAAMPRFLEGDPGKPEKIRPRTTLLREGLDEEPPQAYFLHEEEVPRAGIRVQQSYQRTRWSHGEVFTWLGVRKKTGRGERSSGLAFDQIVPVKKGGDSS